MLYRGMHFEMASGSVGSAGDEKLVRVSPSMETAQPSNRSF